MSKRKRKFFQGVQLELFPKMASKSKRLLSLDWITTKELCDVLVCSRWHLKTLQEQKILKPKKHYQNISPHAARPTYRWHEEECKKAIEALNRSMQDRDSPENLAARVSEE